MNLHLSTVRRQRWSFCPHQQTQTAALQHIACFVFTVRYLECRVWQVEVEACVRVRRGARYQTLELAGPVGKRIGEDK